MTDPKNPVQPPRRAGRKTMAGAGIGLTAAALLFTIVPLEESGRVTKTSVVNGEVKVEHVRGPEHRTAYRDIVGVWTICDGDTKDVRPGMVETREGCARRLEEQIVAHAEPIMRCVPALRRPDRQYQLAASASLAYNIGTSGFCRSTVARRFNAGDWRGGCDAFRMWNKAGGRVVRGLSLRRDRERAICLRGI